MKEIGNVTIKNETEWKYYTKEKAKKTYLKSRKSLKSLNQQYPNSQAKTRETMPYETTLLTICLESFNTNLIMKVVWKFSRFNVLNLFNLP